MSVPTRVAPARRAAQPAPAPWLASLPTAAIAVAFVALAARLILFVHRYAVNILFWDQWSYYQPLFDGDNPLPRFFWQWGFHRMGLSYPAIWALAQISQWDSRYEAFFNVAVVILEALAALWLKRRLTGRLAIWDIAIPVMLLNLFQYEIFLGAPNPENRLPLLLVLLFCLCLLVERVRLRYALLLLVNFVTTFTGYGVFVGCLTPLILLFELARDRAHWRLKLAALGVSLATLAAFFNGYVFSPSVDCYQFPHPRPLEYLQFFTLMYQTFFGFRQEFTWWTPIPALILLAGCGYSAWRLLRSRDYQPMLPVMVLYGFSFVFAAEAAIGRVCLGVGTAIASRYVTYEALGFLALYLTLVTLPRPAPRNGLALLLLSSVVATHALNDGVATRRAEYYFKKDDWKNCYLRYEDIEQCDKRTKFALYPNPAEVHMAEKMAFLKAHKLNLYKD